MPRSLLRLLTLAALLLPAADAAAQFGRRNSAPNLPGPETTRPPPPALPGLSGRRAPDPIPADPNQNLAPNAALFDSINRGDLAAAREAVARGADPEAQNVLGLTPVEAAVDQGQREIMFYLLSVRGAPRGTPASDAAEAARPQPVPPRGRPERAGRQPPPPREPAATMPVRASPRLWAGDGGAPQPAIGFLGFDAGRPAGAMPIANAERPVARRPRSRG